jgi:hypothetical protein
MVEQRRDVGEAAEHLGVGRDDRPVEVGEQLVAVVPTDHAQDGGDAGVGERGVQIRHRGGHR